MNFENQAIFLDRDGVINECIYDKKINSNSPKNLESFRILPKVKEALSIIEEMNFLSIVVTNQPDVSRGIILKEEIEKIHIYMKKNLPITDIYACYDDNDDNPYRKPNNKMITDAAVKWKIELEKSYLVGDRKKDIEAGKKSGCKTFFIDYNRDEEKPNNSDYKVKSLFEAVNIIRNIRK